MTIEEIFEIIKKHKRFSVFTYDTEFEYIECTIGGNIYKIIIRDNNSGILTFLCDLYYVGMSDIKVKMLKWSATESQVLLKFSEVIRYVKKANFFRVQKQICLSKIKPTILSYLKNEHSLISNPDKLNSDIFRMEYPQTYYRMRKKTKTELFNVKKEKKTKNIKYKIYISISNDIFWSHSLYFEYFDSKLTLTLRTENYRIPIDLTKVIRCEKLKNLMLCDAE